jgi:hypothetical protein
MSKFLKIIEENTIPFSKNNTQGKMVDVLAKLLNKIPNIAVVSTSKPEELTVSVGDSMITLHVADVKEKKVEEDNETLNYNLDRGVEGLASKASSGVAGLAGKAIGTSAQRAKSAVKRREDAAKAGLDVYERMTDKLYDAIAASRKDLTTNVNVM